MQKKFKMNDTVLVMRNSGELQQAIVKEKYNNEYLVSCKERNETKCIIFFNIFST